MDILGVLKERNLRCTELYKVVLQLYKAFSHSAFLLKKKNTLTTIDRVLHCLILCYEPWLRSHGI